MDDLVAAAYRDLLQQIGLSGLAPHDRLTVTGNDPVVPSRHFAGTAATASLAAVAAGVSQFRKFRSPGAASQTIEIDLRRAVVVGLRTNLCLRQNGYLLDHLSGNSLDQLSPSIGAPMNHFRTRDARWIFIHRSMVFPETLKRLHDFLDCSLSADAIAARVAQWDGAELEAELAGRKLIATLARSTEEWKGHPAGAWLAKQPAIVIEKLSDSPAETAPPHDRVLAGIRVLDATHVLAGPVTARLFAEHGADVLRISAPHQPDPLPMVMDTGFGKRSAFLDLDRCDDSTRMKELAAQADIFVQSWRPGCMDRRGLSPEELAALRPGLIYVSVSCYGWDGPWAGRGGYEPNSQTACGMTIDEGGEARPRFAPTRTLNDFLAAYLAAAGALAALVRRAREGGSYHVKVSLTGTCMWVQRLGLMPSDVASLVALNLEPHSTDLLQLDSSFGVLEYAAPLVHYSRSPAFYDRPPTVLGASRAEWLPA